MLNDRIRYLRAQIAAYREQIALTAEPELRATFKAVVDLAERELAGYRRDAPAASPPQLPGGGAAPGMSP